MFDLPFYHTSLNYAEKPRLVKEIQSRYNLSPTHKPNTWQEDVHTSIVYGNYANNLEYFKKANIPLDLVIEVDKIVQDAVERFAIADIGKFYIAEMWYNAYKNHQYQHMHKHSDGNNMFFSGIYYMKFNDQEHSATRFYNPHFEVDYEKSSIRKNTFFVQQPPIKEDDVFIFPSDVGHDVLPQNSDDLRISVAFNVACLYNE
jgi:uncharacterized protein (TIGR02466 family)